MYEKETFEECPHWEKLDADTIRNKIKESCQVFRAYRGRSNDDRKGHGFEAQTIDELLLAKDASGATIGLVEIISTTEGYGGGMQFSMGIASDGTTKGISFLSLSETAGLGMRADTDDFKNQFKDKNVEAFSYTKSGASADDEIDALSGATLTTNAVTNGVNAGICCFNYCNESGLLSGEGGNS